jgi:glycosyltransferase involved in cell wall biosynthesis
MPSGVSVGRHRLGKTGRYEANGNSDAAATGCVAAIRRSISAMTRREKGPRCRYSAIRPTHIDFLHFPLFRSVAVQTLTTLHGRQDLADLKPFYSRFGEMPLVSISDDRRKSLPHANFVATIHHGIPADLHRPSFEQGRYLAFLGRISPEKRPDRAIRIARAAGIPLKIAAKVDKVDEEYFRNEILPLIDGPGVEFVGEINEHEKTRFLGEAAALLFPVDWPEPFGL